MCREKVKNIYVMEEHMPVIEQFCKTNRCRISFREAGDKTVERLRAGYPCKGHDVAEKSIKEKTIKKTKSVTVDGTTITKAPGDPDIRQRLEPFSGMIGHWNQGADGVEGIYISAYARNANVSTAPPAWKTALTEIKEKAKNGVVPLTSNLLTAMTADPGNAWRYFLTGDYDLHDLFILEGGRWITCSLDKEKELLNSLANQLERIHNPHKADGSHYKPKDRDDEFSCIRHGAQINYCLHMVLEEPKNSLVYVVVIADHNVAFCDEDGKWTVCDSQKTDEKEAQKERRDKYVKWYETRSLKIKSTFDGNPTVILDLMSRNISLKDYCKTAVHCFFRDTTVREGDAAAIRFLNQLKSAFPGALQYSGSVILQEIKKKYTAKHIADAIDTVKPVQNMDMLTSARKYLETYYSRNPEQCIVFEKK